MAKKFTNGVDLQNQRVFNVGDPSNSTDGANKQYVDNVARGLTYKAPTKAASTSNVSVSSPGATIDGVTLAVGDRVLLKDQSTSSENGIYVWNGASTPLTRANDADSGNELTPGTTVFVTQGTVNADRQYLIISDNAITIGSSAMTWGQFGGGTTYTASNGVVLNGTNFQGVVAAGGGLLVGASGFSIDTTVVTRKISGNLGNGSSTSIAVTHNLATKDVMATLRLNSTDEEWEADWVATDANTVTFTFATAPASAAFRFTIMG